MTVEILQSKSQIGEARAKLDRRGLSYVSPAWQRFLRRAGVLGGINVGHDLKSWDVVKTIEFIERYVDQTGPLLDMGAYASEISVALHRLDYTPLIGIDLNTRLRHMPHADCIRYVVGSFLQAPFANETLAAVTAISVIEHGLRSELLLREVSRLIRPGGYFLASFDYWPDKIDTSGISMFGVDWTIFSRAEVVAFIDEAKTHRLEPCGLVNLEATQPVIQWSDRQYTFAWLALQKLPA